MDRHINSSVRTLCHRIARMSILREMLGTLAALACESYILKDFIQGDSGNAYGVTSRDKAKLVELFYRNTRQIQSGTSALAHTVLAKEILSVPTFVNGDVVECGAWKGASTANLSLVCRMVHRTLLVCDSFAGLPDDRLQMHLVPHAGIYGYYRPGMFCGTLGEVTENVRKFGAYDFCHFVPGFFSESLKSLTQPVVLAFLDVDLASSTCDCLKYLWPLLVERGAIFTDDSGDLDVVRIFFDTEWWRENLNCGAPGYVGSGCGLPLNPRFSPLGYTRKFRRFEPTMWAKASHLYYPATEREEPTLTGNCDGKG